MDSAFWALPKAFDMIVESLAHIVDRCQIYRRYRKYPVRPFIARCDAVMNIAAQQFRLGQKKANVSQVGINGRNEMSRAALIKVLGKLMNRAAEIARSHDCPDRCALLVKADGRLESFNSLTVRVSVRQMLRPGLAPCGGWGTV
jgi:hypothetical protein